VQKTSNHFNLIPASVTKATLNKQKDENSSEEKISNSNVTRHLSVGIIMCIIVDLQLGESSCSEMKVVSTLPSLKS
jgi:hypothetical protein